MRKSTYVSRRTWEVRPKNKANQHRLSKLVQSASSCLKMQPSTLLWSHRIHPDRCHGEWSCICFTPLPRRHVHVNNSGRCTSMNGEPCLPARPHPGSHHSFQRSSSVTSPTRQNKTSLRSNLASPFTFGKRNHWGGVGTFSILFNAVERLFVQVCMLS